MPFKTGGGCAPKGGGFPPHALCHRRVFGQDFETGLAAYGKVFYLLTQPARNLTQSPLRVRAQPLVHTSCIGGGRFETAAAKNALAPKKRATRPREGGEKGRGERI